MIEIHGGQDIHNDEHFIEDFSVTTNYLGPSELAMKHVRTKLNLIQHYPRQDQEPYKTNLEKFLGCENILLGNGASELIDLVIRVLSRTRKRFYIPQSVQYKEYERACTNNFMVRASSEQDADIICIVNPCNPTGDFTETYTLLEDKTYIIDESMKLWHQETFRNIPKSAYVIHSWTKFLSCTGLRIGSVVCPSKEAYDKLRYYQTPWSCNILALEYLDKAIQDQDYMNKTWDSTPVIRKHQKDLIESTFNEWKVHGADFISWMWIELPSEYTAERMYQVAKDSHVPVRWGKTGYNSPKFIRISVRDNTSFKHLINSWVECITPKLEKVDIKTLKCHEHIHIDSGEKLYMYLKSLDVNYRTIPSIVVDKYTRVIIDGHHRFYALQKLGITEIEVTMIDYKSMYVIVNPDKPEVTIDDVLEAGETGRLLEPKTTRHCLQLKKVLKPIICLSTIIIF
jgi:histidinol-phosphate/aromatic aminotransferase/cobyric acid decarboxylase-like protein